MNKNIFFIILFLLSTQALLAGKEEPYIPSKKDPATAMKHYQNSQFDKALDLYKKLAKSGDKHAQYMLSIIYYHGYGVDKDIIESFAWSKLSTETQVNAFENNYKFISQNIADNLKTTALSRYEEIYRNYNDLAVARRYRLIFNKELPMCTGSRIRGNCGNVKASCNGIGNLSLNAQSEERCKEYAKKLDPFYIARIKESSEQVREYILEKSNPTVTISETEKEANP